MQDGLLRFTRFGNRKTYLITDVSSEKSDILKILLNVDCRLLAAEWSEDVVEGIVESACGCAPDRIGSVRVFTADYRKSLIGDYRHRRSPEFKHQTLFRNEA